MYPSTWTTFWSREVRWRTPPETRRSSHPLGSSWPKTLSKCIFMHLSVEYLGHRISGNGLHPTLDKIRAISEAPAPTNVPQLHAFHAKILPRLFSMLAPLYWLLQTIARWSWGPEEDRALQTAKLSLTSSSVLIQYDPAKELFLDCDASLYGVGAVLLHRMADSSMKPIAYASHSLNPAKKRYRPWSKKRRLSNRV